MVNTPNGPAPRTKAGAELSQTSPGSHAGAKPQAVTSQAAKQTGRELKPQQTRQESFRRMTTASSFPKSGPASGAGNLRSLFP